jgi:hypothetical protein
MMNGQEALSLLLGMLDRENLPYMVVGSFSSNYHGIPRSTKDADIVLEFEPTAWSNLEKNLPAGLMLDPQGGFEMVTATRKEVVRVAGSAFEIELFHLSADPFDQASFKRREKVSLSPETTAWVATAEDVVIQKLRWTKGGLRSKDFEDVVNVLLRKGKDLDFAHIEHWCCVHSTTELLKKACAVAGG